MIELGLGPVLNRTFVLRIIQIISTMFVS